MVRNNQNNNFEKFNLTNTKGITLINQTVNDNEVFTKSNVDQSDQENERPRRDVELNFYIESSD